MIKYAHKSVFYFISISIIRLFIFLILAFCITFSEDTGKISHFTEVQSLIKSQKISHYKQLGYSLISNFQNTDIISEGVYVIINDFVINNHQSITILPNSVLLFEPGKSVVVNGELTSKGNNMNRVVFSNVPKKHSYITIAKEDSLWNGIKVGEEGKIDLRYTVLKNSTSGIHASYTKDSIAISGVEFINVGRPHLKIGKNRSLLITPVQSEADFPVLSSPYSWNMSYARIGTGISCGIFFVGTLASAILHDKYYNKARKEMINIQKAKEYEKLSNITFTSSIICGSLALASASGFSLTFMLLSKTTASK